MSSPLRALGRVLVYAILTFTLLPVQVIAVKANLRLATTLPVFYHRLCARILGFSIRTHGRAETDGPSLYVCNHISYADIPILGALLPASFVAKSEVATWPFFGTLARLQRSVFIDRHGRRATEHRDEMVRRLETGANLILFAEGTSSNGNVVLPFKSALFSVAEIRPSERPLPVRPVSIAYTRLDGMPIGRAMRPLFAWYGDAPLLTHCWSAVGLGRITVDVVFHEPVTIEQFGSRKKLADHCFEVVSEGVSAANSGRLELLAGPNGQAWPAERSETPRRAAARPGSEGVAGGTPLAAAPARTVGSEEAAPDKALSQSGSPAG